MSQNSNSFFSIGDPLINTHLQALLPAIACSLKQLCLHNVDHPASEETTGFYGQEIPGISVRDYMLRLQEYADCSCGCFFAALILIDRFTEKRPDVPVNAHTVHRLLLTALVLAVKYWDDVHTTNAFYSKMGGVPVDILNRLELEFLFSIDFDLQISPEVFSCYFQHLAVHAHSAELISNATLFKFENKFELDPTIARSLSVPIKKCVCVEDYEEDEGWYECYREACEDDEDEGQCYSDSDPGEDGREHDPEEDQDLMFSPDPDDAAFNSSSFSPPDPEDEPGYGQRSSKPVMIPSSAHKPHHNSRKRRTKSAAYPSAVEKFSAPMEELDLQRPTNKEALWKRRFRLGSLPRGASLIGVDISLSFAMRLRLHADKCNSLPAAQYSISFSAGGRWLGATSHVRQAVIDEEEPIHF